MSNAARKPPPVRVGIVAGMAVIVLASFGLFTAEDASGPAILVKLAPAESSADAGASVLVLLPLDTAGGGDAEPIVEGFEIASSPRVSFDGRRALFSGRRVPSDPIEIWEVAVAGSGLRRVVSGGDCLEPCYVPGGRVVYTRLAGGAGDVGGGHPDFYPVRSLHIARLDGGGERRITFGAAEDRAPELASDGCIVFRRRQPDGRQHLFAVRTDGTGLQLFCAPAAGASIVAGPWRAGDELIFIEQPSRPEDGAGDGGGRTPRRLVTVPAGQPLGARREFPFEPSLSALPVTWSTPTAAAWAGAARVTSVAELEHGRFLASVAAGPGGGILVELRIPETAGAPLAISELDMPGIAGDRAPTAVAIAAPRPPPLELTSVVDESMSTGRLLCVDVRNSMLGSVARVGRDADLTVRVLTADGRHAVEADVEADGSFVVDVPADHPLRIELHGASGLIAADTSGFWVRPNESRGCVGCHEDPELAPENRVPYALERDDSLSGREPVRGEVAHPIIRSAATDEARRQREGS